MSQIQILLSLIFFIVLSNQTAINDYNDKYCKIPQVIINGDFLDIDNQLQLQIKKLRTTEKLELYLKNKDDYKQYIEALIILMLPWAIFFILTILTFLIILIFCCCRQVPTVKPTPKRLNNLFLLIFSITLMAFSFGGLIMGPQLQGSYDATQCAIFNSFYAIQDGNNFGWMGTNDLQTKINQIKMNLGNVNQEINNAYKSGQFEITSEVDDVKNKITDMNTQFHEDVSQNYFVDSVGTKVAKFQIHLLKKELGPLTKINTICNLFQTEQSDRSTIVSDFINGVQKSQEIVNNQFDTIQDVLNKTVNELSTLNSQLNIQAENLSNLHNLKDNVFEESVNDKQKSTSVVVFSIFIVFFIFGFLPFLSIICLKCCDNKSSKCFGLFILRFSWVLTAFLALFGFILCLILAPFSTFSQDICNVYSQSIKNETYFNEYLGDQFFFNYQSVQDSVKTYISPCVWGNGNIIQALGAQAQIDLLNDVTSNFYKYAEISNPNSQVQKSINSPSIESSNLEYLVNNITKGSTPDLNIQYPNEDIFDYYQIHKFNSYTNDQSGTYFTTNQDYWTYSWESCPQGYTNFTGTSGTDQNTGQKICIPVNQFNKSWLSARYPCNSSNVSKYYALQMMQQYLPKLQTYKSQRDVNYFSNQPTYVSLLNENQLLGSSMLNLNDKVKTAINNLENLNQTIIQYVDSVSGSNGIVNNLNCTIVYSIMQNFNKTFCNQFVPVSNLLLIFMAGCGLSFYFKMIFEYQLDLEVYKKSSWQANNSFHMNEKYIDEQLIKNINKNKKSQDIQLTQDQYQVELSNVQIETKQQNEYNFNDC